MKNSISLIINKENAEYFITIKYCKNGIYIENSNLKNNKSKIICFEDLDTIFFNRKSIKYFTFVLKKDCSILLLTKIKKKIIFRTMLNSLLNPVFLSYLDGSNDHPIVINVLKE